MPTDMINFSVSIDPDWEDGALGRRNHCGVGWVVSLPVIPAA